MPSNYVNTIFVITNNQDNYQPDQIWVSFAGTFTNTGVAQTIGTQTIADFSSTWRSFNLTALSAPVPSLPYFGNQPQYTFSLNGFSGRIYINYGSSALSAPPTPSSPGNSPYIVFEPTVLGQTLPAPTPSQSNMDLSYVDGVSGPAGMMICDATTGAALQATSVNPITSTAAIMGNVAALVPSAAAVVNGGATVRIMSSAAAPAAYHDWHDLIASLQTITATSPLNVCSYTSPATGIPSSFALSGALFGYSGAPAIPGQAANFNQAQGYTTTATFVTDLNPSGSSTLSNLGIPAGTPGVDISGSGTVAGSFNIYITNANLNAGTGIYGNNPPYVVAATGGTAYATNGIVNDLGGRIVGDLMAGMVFGWAASTLDIASQATATNTNLYGTTFSSSTVGGLMTGELFFLLSLAGAQGTLTDWIGPSLDSTTDHYDQYLYAIAANSDAYGSGFTDRLQGYSNPDTYWYTANPPAIPGGNGNYQPVGFVNMFLGCVGPTFTIQANQSWFDTGIVIQPGSTVTVAYQSGLWTADPQTNNGQLYDANGCPGLTVTQPGYPLQNVNMGALVGQVGSNSVFLIGNGPTTVPSGQSGTLKLCVNDDLKGLYGAGLTDNSGSVTVIITTE